MATNDGARLPAIGWRIHQLLSSQSADVGAPSLFAMENDSEMALSLSIHSTHAKLVVVIAVFTATRLFIFRPDFSFFLFLTKSQDPEAAGRDVQFEWNLFN